MLIHMFLGINDLYFLYTIGTIFFHTPLYLISEKEVEKV